MNLLTLRAQRAGAEKELLFFVRAHWDDGQALLDSMVQLDECCFSARAKLKERFLGNSQWDALMALEEFIRCCKAVGNAEAQLAPLAAQRSADARRNL